MLVEHIFQLCGTALVQGFSGCYNLRVQSQQCVVRNGSETGRYLCRALGAAANCDTVCSVPKL